jgi:hypothetical protein
VRQPLAQPTNDKGIPSLFYVISEAKGLQIRRVDHAMIVKRLEVNKARPVIMIETQYRDRWSSLPPYEIHDFKHSSSVPKPPGKTTGARARFANCNLRIAN